MSFILRIRASLHVLVTYIKKLNVYTETNDDPPYVRENQLQATRVYLILLILTMSILSGYTALSRQTLIVNVENPSQADYERLQALYPNTISCPCSHIIISYGSFITINATFHQVCSSDFVSDAWVDHLVFDNPVAMFYPLDVRSSVSSQFQLLKALCLHSQEAVSDGMISFMTSKLITPTMLPRSTFDTQVGLIVNDSRTNLLAEQQRTTQLTRAVNEQNQLPTALGTNFLYIATEYDRQRLYFVQYPSVNSTNSYCSCQSSFDCMYPAGIYSELSGINALMECGLLQTTHVPDFTLPGMLVGCFPLNTILQSTLECLFNSICLVMLQSSLPNGSSLTVIPLNNASKTRFSSSTTVQMIVDELFLEEWVSISNYSAFYEQCHPTACTYSYIPTVNTASVISTIISLFGGLSIALMLIARLIVTIYQKIRGKIRRNGAAHINNVENIAVRPSICERSQRILKYLRDKLLQLNIFKHPLNDEYGRRTEILTTRVYFVLLIGSLVILAFYTLVIEHTQTVQIQKPSISVYRRLMAQHGATLSCPCAQITASYDSFISVTPVYHQLCSSIYVTGSVFPKFPLSNASFQLGIFDFNFFGPSFFSLLPKLCTLSQNTINDAIVIFNATKYVSATLTSELELIARANTFLNTFQTQVVSTFRHALQLNLDSTQGNWLVTAPFTNAYLHQDSPNPSLGTLGKLGIWWINPLDPACNCGTSSTRCLISFARYCETSIFALYLNCYSLINQTINGLVLGCDPMDGVLHSTLECLFDITCIQMILIAVQYYSISLGSSVTPTDIVPLDPTLLRYFKPDTIILDIVENLMIEEWESSISFETYFAQCHPTICLYTFTQRFDLLNTIVTVVGLAGGLSVVLRILVPLVMTLIRRKKSQKLWATRSILINSRLREQLFRRIVRWARELNWFQRANLNGDESILRDQILTTRLYIVLFCLSLLGVFLVTTVPQQTVTYVINNPSEATYDQFKADQSTFTCTCSNINIQYSSFISLPQPTLHQVCSSSYINQAWISAAFGDAAVSRSIGQGFLSAQFRLLAAFCQSSQQTLVDALESFGSTQFISTTLITRSEFTEQMNFTLIQFYAQAPGIFRRALSFILDVTLGNQVISAYEGNWYVMLGIYPSVDMMPRYYGNCSCGSFNASDCVTPLLLNNDSVAVNGMLVGCLPLSSLLESSLTCFYEEDCLLQVLAALKLNLLAPTLNVSVLNSSIDSRFKPDTPLEDIINDLFVETWALNVNYSAYFNECAAKTCTYSLVQRNNVLVAVTKFIALYGGMTVVLQMVARLLIKIRRINIKKIMLYRERKVKNAPHF